MVDNGLEILVCDDFITIIHLLDNYSPKQCRYFAEDFKSTSGLLIPRESDLGLQNLPHSAGK